MYTCLHNFLTSHIEQQLIVPYCQTVFDSAPFCKMVTILVSAGVCKLLAWQFLTAHKLLQGLCNRSAKNKTLVFM